AEARLTCDPDFVATADAVVLPGVGAFGACMDALRAAGLEKVVHQAVDSGRPFLGICVGMQMLFTGSEENLEARGLDIISGMVTWIPPGVKRPQMQWNKLNFEHPKDPMFAGPLLSESADGSWVYFVHSLHGVPNDDKVIAATCEYGGTLNAAFRLGNVFATQFHPEKSGASGLALLDNFVKAVGKS
ncbi:MAG: imidazole glycerol phosphate synthase subunit HisH, partial [Ilumatobacteraceae bacterium]|nr:imidazole glycerol phosphate synthase subunit HisH [Ilumatobacteraceae bacterium]